MPYIVIFRKKLKIFERWRYRSQTPALLLTHIVSVAKLKARNSSVSYYVNLALGQKDNDSKRTVFAFGVQWRSKGKGKWGHVSRGEDLGGASTLYSTI